MTRFLSHINIQKFIYRVTHWETWHWIAKYIPMIPFWIGYCIKARSCWFFTAANPTLTFGGYEGENKMEMYNLLPDGTYPKTVLVPSSSSKSQVEKLFLLSGFTFPVAAKPDVGRMGLMFRKLNSVHELLKYHTDLQADFILQEFIHYPLEVSVFYYRFPNFLKGNITGFVRKDYLSVTGDGVSTLHELMHRYQRVQFRLEEMTAKHFGKLNDVIPHGEIYILSEALNLSRGGKLVSLAHERDENLLKLLDDFSHKGDFYFGRYDIKCASISDLKKGKNFSILEFNGSGAEPHHVYGNGNSLFKAIKILLDHWNILCMISIHNHKKNGIPYWGFLRGVRHLATARKHFKKLKQLEYRGVDFISSSVNETPVQNKAPILQAYKLTVNNYDGNGIG